MKINTGTNKNQVQSRKFNIAHLTRNVSTLVFRGTVRPGGGALGYFLGGCVPPGAPNWHPVLKKISLKIDTLF